MPTSTPVKADVGVTITPPTVPGLTYSPTLLLALTLVGSALTEAVAFGILSAGLAQTAAAIAAPAVSLVVLLYDAIVRVAHSKAVHVSSPLLSSPGELIAGVATAASLSPDELENLEDKVTSRVLRRISTAAAVQPRP